MESKQNLWEAVSNKCLSEALALLEKDAGQTASAAAIVKELVSTAISIDMLNLQWARQNLYGAAGHSDRVFRQK